MGWGFRKSIKIAPGVRVNLSKSGISTSIGGKGFTYNSCGRITASIPGTGIRFTHNINARRTANPVRSVVAGSSRIDSANIERLSKREQAARDFVAQVQERTTHALLQYFMSHGVYVRRDDLADAVTLEEYQAFLETLTREFEATTKAIKLAVDIGSISLAEKEKAMHAVYEIERKCAANLGDRGQLANEAESLSNAVLTWPKAPTFVAPFVVGLLGSLFVSVNNLAVGLVLLAVALAYGLYSLTAFNKKRATTAEHLEEAHTRFDSLLAVEVSPRPALAEVRDHTQARAVGFAVLTVALATFAGFHRTQDGHQAAALSPDTSATVSLASSVERAQEGNAQPPDFSWLVGKYPSDVVTDRRFRAAFNHVSRSDWKKFIDRLAVTNSTGIALKDGYIVGEGWSCPCNSGHLDTVRLMTPLLA